MQAYIPCRLVYPCQPDDGTKSSHSYLLRDERKIPLGHCRFVEIRP